MADLKLVIRIPERDYDLACNYPEVLIATYAHCIKNGIPLPKGHGRLKDVDRLESHDEYDGQGFTKSVYKDDIDNLPTIIEADKVDQDRMESDNPITDEEDIDAISLRYLDSLPTIIKADKDESRE